MTRCNSILRQVQTLPQFRKHASKILLHLVSQLRLPTIVCKQHFSTSTVSQKTNKASTTEKDEADIFGVLTDVAFKEGVLLPQSWDRGGLEKSNALSPLLASTRRLIDEHKGCVCLIQVGSFYELYFEQASIIGPKLGIKVATRKTSNHQIPMAGFPLSQLQKFVKIIVHDLHLNAAIVDQFGASEDSTNLKHRKVSRIISPGTLVDELFLNYSQNNYLVAVQLPHKSVILKDLEAEVGILWVDVSLGESFVQSSTIGELAGDLRRISPSEIILPKEFQNAGMDFEWLSDIADLKKYFVRFHKTTYKDYKLHLQNNIVATRKLLESLSVREEAALNLVLSYVNVNLPDRQLLLDIPTRHVSSRYLNMDSRTRDALELTGRSTFGTVSVVGSLLNTIKNTVSPSGSRLLTQWIKLPIMDENELRHRYEFVALFQKNAFLRLHVRLHLSHMGDFVRSLQKLTLKTGSPVVNLQSVAVGLTSLQQLHKMLSDPQENLTALEKELLSNFLHVFDIPSDIAVKILDTFELEEHKPIVEESTRDFPQSLEDQLISGSNLGLDGINAYVKKSSANPTQELQEFVVKKDFSRKLSSLHRDFEAAAKREINFVGEVAASVKELDPKATVVQKDQVGRHFNVLSITSRSKNLEGILDLLVTKHELDLIEKKKISLLMKASQISRLTEEKLTLMRRILEEERKIIESLSEEVLKEIFRIRAAGRKADFLDVTASFGQIAQQNNWVRPQFTSTTCLEISEGRHPVVEASLRSNGQNFMVNDTRLGKNATLWVISGPNMGGKSTFLRQNALIVIMAQIGSFVPASRAKLCLVDRLFTRIGASDDIFSDLSTFMVEMLETSNILRNATSKSLAIVDEIGRGTSGREGLAIAYATLVSLLTENKCRTLFATHFGHELKALLSSNGIREDKLQFLRTSVSEKEGTLFFDHRLEPGISERSYAFEVAKLAGFPEKSLAHATRALELIGRI